RELVDQGTPIEAACRIVILEDQLEEAQRLNAACTRVGQAADAPAGHSRRTVSATAPGPRTVR
ncbi:hypothetical protein ABZT03_40425, partial [Streptomyces sp. NPDC005574]